MVWDVSVIVSSGQSEISLHLRATAVGFNFRKSSSQKISLKPKRGTPKEEDCSQRMHLGVKDELSGGTNNLNLVLRGTKGTPVSE